MTRKQHRIALRTSRGLRSARRRAGMLVAVWALSGLWDVGHALAHEMEHESGHHFDEAPEALCVAMAASHGHSHLHPDSFPVVSTGKAPRFEVPALLAGAPAVGCEATLLRWTTRTAPDRTSPSKATASGPRAPPLS